MLKNLYLTNRFFYFGAIIIGFFALSFPFPLLFPLAQTCLFLGLILVIADSMLLFQTKKPIKANRILPKMFSLSDANKVQIELLNQTNQPLKLNVIDEIPIQFQKRDFELKTKLNSKQEQVLSYDLRPTERGDYSFGAINIFISSILGFIERRLQFNEGDNVPVFPSVIQMKQLSLMALQQTMLDKGIKKLRRIGHSYEFEQIKTYVKGDDYRSINWKASGRRNEVMVNQYEDEKSQQIYCLIDKSRIMKMPFEELTLMDYAINSSLAISNVVLEKKDKVGLVTFSDKLGTVLKAEKHPNQLQKILNALYNEQTNFSEANYELLYHISRKLIKNRSLIFLFTNFENHFALERVLPLLRKMNTFHLLVVVFFENTEIKDFASKKAQNTEEMCHQTVAQQFVYDKLQMTQILKQYGIQTIYTRPKDLSINTINKYLELKSRGLI